MRSKRAFGWGLHAKEIITRYSAEPAVFQHKALMINVNRTAAERSLYEATRYAWKISISKAKDALGSSGARLLQRSGSSM